MISKTTRGLYQHLHSEVIGVHYRWTVSQQLFSTQETVDLLNKSARRFFLMIRFDLLDAIVLALSRLIDPAISSNKNRNASLQQLIDSLDQQSYSDLIQALKQDLVNIKSKCKRIKKWRDKWAAHRDLEAIVQPISAIGFSVSEVEDALAELRSFMHKFEDACQDPEPQYVYNNQVPPIEFAKFVHESERLRIRQPINYEHLLFEDDGNTIIDLIRRASATAQVSP